MNYALRRYVPFRAASETAEDSVVLREKHSETSSMGDSGMFTFDVFSTEVRTQNTVFRGRAVGGTV